MNGQVLVQRQHRSSSSMGAGGLVRVIFVSIGLAVFFGLVAATASLILVSTANPILESMAATLLVAVALLEYLAWLYRRHTRSRTASMP